MLNAETGSRIKNWKINFVVRFKSMRPEPKRGREKVRNQEALENKIVKNGSQRKG